MVLSPAVCRYRSARRLGGLPSALAIIPAYILTNGRAGPTRQGLIDSGNAPYFCRRLHTDRKGACHE